MSARDIALPDQAFAEMIAGFGARVRALEMEAMWSGVVRTDIDNVGGTKAYQYVAAGGYPDSGALTVASLVLDPGRWVLLSMLSVFISVGSDGGGSPNYGQVGGILKITSGLDVRTRYSLIQQRGGGLPGIAATVTSAMEYLSPATITASLRFFYGLDPNAPDGFGTGTWSRATLLAFPG